MISYSGKIQIVFGVKALGSSLAGNTHETEKWFINISLWPTGGCYGAGGTGQQRHWQDRGEDGKYFRLHWLLNWSVLGIWRGNSQGCWHVLIHCGSFYLRELAPSVISTNWLIFLGSHEFAWWLNINVVTKYITSWAPRPSKLLTHYKQQTLMASRDHWLLSFVFRWCRWVHLCLSGWVVRSVFGQTK